MIEHPFKVPTKSLLDGHILKGRNFAFRNGNFDQLEMSFFGRGRSAWVPKEMLISSCCSLINNSRSLFVEYVEP